MPAELRALFRDERDERLGLLMRVAARTLLELGADERHPGAQLGLSAVLHTWSRDLSWHPHVHCVVTGGGLREDGTFAATSPRFLFPVRVLGRLFRGKLLDALARLHRAGGLELTGARGALRDPQAWSSLLGRLYAKDWVVYCKAPFAGVDSVYAYLGRYTHRIGLSNRRSRRTARGRLRGERRARRGPGRRSRPRGAHAVDSAVGPSSHPAWQTNAGMQRSV